MPNVPTPSGVTPTPQASPVPLEQYPDAKPLLRTQLLRAGGGTLLLRLLSVALEFGVVTVLARALDPEGYGVYAYAYSVMRVLAVPAQAGLPTLTVREVAFYHARHKWGEFRGLLLRTNQIAILLASAIAVIAGPVAWAVTRGNTPDFLSTFLAALILLPLVALGNLRGAVLRGLRHVVVGQLPESVLRPALLLASTLLLAVSIPSHHLTPPLIMGLHVLSAAIAFTVGWRLLLRELPSPVRQARPVYDTRRWATSAIPLSLVMGMTVANTQAPLLVLGCFSSSFNVGVYGAASQLALAATLPLTSANVATAPHIARLYAQQDIKNLQKLATWSARLLSAAAVLTLTIATVAGASVLPALFGERFTPGYFPFVVLTLGHSTSAVAGVSMILLNMTRHEQSVARSVAVALATNLGFCFALIPLFGIHGAAVSAALGLVVLNLMLASQVRRKLRIEPLPFALRSQWSASGDATRSGST